MKMLKFLRMVRRLGGVPIDIQVHFGNRQVAHEPSDAFLVARWTVKLGGMKLPFSSKVLQDRRVEIEAETVFHVSENKIDYMRIDTLLVNGRNYAQANEEQIAHEGDTSALVPAVFLITPKQEVDIYRDTILRYAGYLNEIGEAFQSNSEYTIFWVGVPNSWSDEGSIWGGAEHVITMDLKQISPSDGGFFHFRAGNFHFRAQPSRFRA